MRAKGAVQVRSPKAFTKPRKLALLIGVGEYKDPKWSPLKYPESDVDKLKEVLERKGNFDRILTLKGQAVTRENILISLQSLRRDNKSKNDIVAIYFSGHGTLDLDHLGNMLQYFVSHEARFDAISSSALSMKKIFTIFDSFASEKKVLILASCYSGAGKSVLRADILNEIRRTKSSLTTLLPPLEKVSKASIILSSSAMGDVSYEDDNLQGDIYTHFLIEGLETRDSNQDGAVTATEAHSHFSITDSQAASPLYLNAGATYKGQNFLFTLDTKYYFSTEKSYQYVSDKFKVGNKTFGYNGPALSAGFTYFF